MTRRAVKRPMHRRPQPAPPPDPFPLTFETFREIDGYDRRTLETSEPACFNGYVRVARYRVTVERIAEPVEVIHARILKLWRESANYHDIKPLRRAAAKYGLELDQHEHGRDTKRTR